AAAAFAAAVDVAAALGQGAADAPTPVAPADGATQLASAESLTFEVTPSTPAMARPRTAAMATGMATETAMRVDRLFSCQRRRHADRCLFGM
ncbi:MAG: hypothetical protein ACRDNW_08885, partial [Trebonia sp.]